MDDDKVKKQVSDNLKKIQVAEEAIPKNQYALLCRLQEFYNQVFQERADAYSVIKRNRLTPANVAKELEISRNSMYRYPIANQYLDYLNCMLQADNPFVEIEEARRTINDLKKQIERMLVRDIDWTIAENHIDRLERQLQEKQRLLDEARTKIASQAKQISSAKKQVTSNENKSDKIVKLSFDNHTKIISWNVRGLEACFKRGGLDEILSEKPDFVCLQEIQVIKPEKIDKMLKNFGYVVVCNPSSNGIFKSGTLTMARNTVISHELTFPNNTFQDEGRYICCELEEYYLVNIYVPANSSPERLAMKSKWWEAFLNQLTILQQKKPVILCGDFNATYDSRDIINIAPNTAGCTSEEQKMLLELLNIGFIDVFRDINPTESLYTWRDKTGRSGMRLDYFFVSSNFNKEKIIDVVPVRDIRSSDHLPLELVLQ